MKKKVLSLLILFSSVILLLLFPILQTQQHSVSPQELMNSSAPK
ncbi:hypothetical protein [Bombilactobacillus apium]|nr:hypothetical protein [Bombilactobacillus apium]